MNDGLTDSLTRRQALAAAAAIGATATACSTAVDRDAAGAPRSSAAGDPRAAASSSRQPVVFLPHGGGPWPFVDVGIGDRAELDALSGYLRSLATLTPVKPRAVLMVSAHWEERVPTVQTAARPPLLFDYYGFPEASYRLTWPAPGDPALAARVQVLLQAGGFATGEDASRGYDHGAFVPMKVTWPEADLPTVQLSLKRGLDPAEHLAMGRALAPLRDEGILILGSGMSYHNLRLFGPAGRAPAAAFDAWLGESVALDPAARAERLTRWSAAPAARQAHPREEHLLPLMVIAGAAGEDRGRVAYNGTILGLKLSAVHFG